jgi:hypothetical protein
MPRCESLAQRQRLLLAALKGRAAGAGGFAAPELALLRETLLWWRGFGIARSCRFTAALLKAQGRFEDVIEAFVRDTPGADDIETQRELFLAHAQRDPDPLCAALAATEAALLHRQGVHDEAEREILWPRDPEPVFATLLRGECPPAAACDQYTVIVGRTGGSLGWRRATCVDPGRVPQQSAPN